jgi:hypothetical protein
MRSNHGMRFSASLVLAGGLLLVTASAQAVVPRPTNRRPAQALTAMPAAAVSKPLRAQRGLRWSQSPTAAWTKFATAAGGSWRAAWDQATGVPSRIWGSGIPAPGAMASAAVAEAFARQMLADHLALLAPGAAITDFELVSNHFDGAIRSIGFVQRIGGRRVVGGQISFRFKRDRLFVIGSEALPDVAVQEARTKLTRAAIRTRATTALRHDLDLPNAPVTDPSEEVVLPLVADDAVLGYRIAREVTIDGGADGRYLAYADAATGEVLAVHQQNLYTTGTVKYRAVDRNPGRPRIDVPAPRAHVMVDGAPQTTATDGSVTWSTSGSQTVTTAVVGDLVTIVNKATSSALAVADLALVPGGQIVWDASATPEDDAQIQTYLATNKVKDFVARELDANMPKLGEPITANVNIAQDCNAFFDGKSINFFHASAMCQNTGLIEDVVFHEFGHALHTSEIIDGVGSFDGAMSEGAADFLAASVTGDHGMGRGFFYTETPLRDLDPDGMEYSWPVDVQEIHHTGMIYGGALWDLRKALIAALGEAQGIALTQKLYLGTLRRSINIPTSLIEALAEDDDDGNLANGTPHECFIRDAYGRHGLRTATGTIAAPAVMAGSAGSTVVRVDLTGLSERCSGDEIESVTIDWKPSSIDMPAAGSAIATSVGPATFWAQIPLAREGKVLYRARVKFVDGTGLTLADNLADPYYELYQGHTIPLYCTNFEDADPFTQGWTTGTNSTAESPWAWGEPVRGATDPPAAYSGTHFLAQGLGTDYPAASMSWVKMPTIDVGRWTDVRLQYRRWLAVEDSYYDQARVTVNGVKAWQNFTANNGTQSSTHHIDREWRFHDVLLSGWSQGHEITVGWDLTSDEGLSLGGWQLDDVCIVANINSVCGDGVKSPTEGCDDGAGNADQPDKCRTYCQNPVCGDGIVDLNEECDHGPDGDARCTNKCLDIAAPSLGGCCSANGGSAGPIALTVLVGALVVGRRRRRT